MDSLRETLSKAGGVPETASRAIDGSVDAVVYTVSKQVAIAAESVGGYVEIARAHGDTATARVREYEDRLFKTPTATIARALAEYPYQVVGAVCGASLLLLPGTRRSMTRSLLGARRSEESIFKACERNHLAAKESVALAEKELALLRTEATSAEVEMLRGKSRLRKASGDLKRLLAKTNGDSVAVENAVLDLRQVPSSSAVALRTEAAATRSAIAKVKRGVESALAGVWRAGVPI